MKPAFSFILRCGLTFGSLLGASALATETSCCAGRTPAGANTSSGPARGTGGGKSSIPWLAANPGYKTLRHLAVRHKFTGAGAPPSGIVLVADRGEAGQLVVDIAPNSVTHIDLRGNETKFPANRVVRWKFKQRSGNVLIDLENGASHVGQMRLFGMGKHYFFTSAGSYPAAYPRKVGKDGASTTSTSTSAAGDGECTYVESDSGPESDPGPKDIPLSGDANAPGAGVTAPGGGDGGGNGNWGGNTGGNPDFTSPSGASSFAGIRAGVGGGSGDDGLLVVQGTEVSGTTNVPPASAIDRDTSPYPTIYRTFSGFVGDGDAAPAAVQSSDGELTNVDKYKIVGGASDSPAPVRVAGTSLGAVSGQNRVKVTQVSTNPAKVKITFSRSSLVPATEASFVDYRTIIVSKPASLPSILNGPTSLCNPSPWTWTLPAAGSASVFAVSDSGLGQCSLDGLTITKSDLLMGWRQTHADAIVSYAVKVERALNNVTRVRATVSRRAIAALPAADNLWTRQIYALEQYYTEAVANTLVLGANTGRWYARLQMIDWRKSYEVAEVNEQWLDSTERERVRYFWKVTAPATDTAAASLRAMESRRVTEPSTVMTGNTATVGVLTGWQAWAYDGTGRILKEYSPFVNGTGGTALATLPGDWINVTQAQLDGLASAGVRVRHFQRDDTTTSQTVTDYAGNVAISRKDIVSIRDTSGAVKPEFTALGSDARGTLTKSYYAPATPGGTFAAALSVHTGTASLNYRLKDNTSSFDTSDVVSASYYGVGTSIRDLQQPSHIISSYSENYLVPLNGVLVTQTSVSQKMADSAFSLLPAADSSELDTEVTTYDADGRIISRAVNGVASESYSYIASGSNLSTTSITITGASKVVVTDRFGRLLSSQSLFPTTAVSVPVDGSNIDLPLPPAQVVENYSRTPRTGWGLTTTATRQFGGVALRTITQSDAAGRTRNTTDTQGRTVTTNYSFASNGLVLSTMLDTALIELTRSVTALDGLALSDSRADRAVRNYSYLPESSGFQTQTKNSATQILETVWTDGSGRIVRKETPGLLLAGPPTSLTNSTGTVIEIRTYAVDGSLAGVKRPGAGPVTSNTALDSFTAFSTSLDGTERMSGMTLNGTVAAQDGLGRKKQIFTYDKDAQGAWARLTASQRDTEDAQGTVTTLMEASRNRVYVGQTLRALPDSGAWRLISYRTAATGVTKFETVAEEILPGTQVRRTTTRNSGASRPQVTYYLGDLPVLSTAPGASGYSLTTYDSLGRVIGVTDPRTGLSSITTYVTIGTLATTLVESHKAAGHSSATQYSYYTAQSTIRPLLRSRTDPDHVATTNERVHYYGYDAAGRIIQQWGASEYPLQFSYDLGGEGRMTGMKTYRSLTALPAAPALALPASAPVWTGTSDNTTWAYHSQTGLLTSKTDAASKAVTYLYWPNGQLRRRTWARGAITDYSYDAYQRLTAVTYPPTNPVPTPNVALEYFPSGRIKFLDDAAGRHAFQYNLLGQEIKEEIANSVLPQNYLSGYSRTVAYDPDFRITGVSVDGLLQASDIPDTDPVLYAYSATTGQMSLVRRGKYAVNYAYHPGTNQVAGKFIAADGAAANIPTGPQSGSSLDPYNVQVYVNFNAPSDIQARAFLRSNIQLDDRGTIKSITHQSGEWASGQINTVDEGRMINKITLADGTEWRYGYNNRREVNSAVKHTSTLAAAAEINGYGATYNYDEIGNRNATGQATGTPRVTTAYSANALNQYTAITNPQISPLRGVAPAASSVTVDGTALPASARQFSGYYFQARNSTGKLEYQSILFAGIPWTTPGVTAKYAYVPPAAEALAYDFDGNLLSDGRGTYTWNAENQLVAFTSSYGPGPGFTAETATYAYDARGRRIRKTVDTVDDSGQLTTSTVDLFAWNGWQLARRVTAVTSHRTGYDYMHTRTHHDYTWGLDVSHTLEGAGCVGGLLMVRAPLATAVVATDSYSLPTEVPVLDPYFPAAGATVYDTWFPTYDHNGNVNHLVREPTLLTPASTDPYGVPVPATYTTRLDATYEYDAFGNILRATGPAAEWNPFTFSTKYLDKETGWSYYGYRYYDALRGRWPSRDPIAEKGGLNLYGTVGNNAVSNIDVLGKIGSGNGAYLPGITPGLPNSNYVNISDPTEQPFKWMGCGSATELIGHDSYVPDKPLGCDFSKACEDHDKCYETCGKSQKQCDEKFFDDLKKARKPVLLDLGDKGQLCVNCDFLASIYFRFVTLGGASSYEEGQKKGKCK